MNAYKRTNLSVLALPLSFVVDMKYNSISIVFKGSGLIYTSSMYSVRYGLVRSIFSNMKYNLRLNIFIGSGFLYFVVMLRMGW